MLRIPPILGLPHTLNLKTGDSGGRDGCRFATLRCPDSESDIRVNDNNLLQLVGGCNSTTASNEQFYSTDGGKTWLQSSLPTVSGDNRQGDPAVDWTSDGTAWALAVGIGTTGNVIRAFKSADAGKTW